MLTMLPSWYMEAEGILDEAVRKIMLKNHINIYSVDDSRSINNAKKNILRSLVWIYENVNVEERLRLEKFFDDIKVKKKSKEEKKSKTKK